MGLWVWNVNDPQVSPGPGLAESHSSTLPTWTVFTRSSEDVFDFILGHSVVIGMRLPRLRIKIEAKIHALHPSDSYEWRANTKAQPRASARRLERFVRGC
jgi:hypothetical protein